MLLGRYSQILLRPEVTVIFIIIVLYKNATGSQCNINKYCLHAVCAIGSAGENKLLLRSPPFPYFYKQDKKNPLTAFAVETITSLAAAVSWRLLL